MNTEYFQIGWYNLDKDEVMTNTYECAAWYERIIVKSGKYPVMANKYFYHERDRYYTNKINDTSILIKFDGILESDNFQSLFCGNAIGGKYDHFKNAGQEKTHYSSPYAHSIAKSIIEDTSKIELLPEFQAQEIKFNSIFDNEELTTYGIFKI